MSLCFLEEIFIKILRSCFLIFLWFLIQLLALNILWVIYRLSEVQEMRNPFILLVLAVIIFLVLGGSQRSYKKEWEQMDLQIARLICDSMRGPYEAGHLRGVTKLEYEEYYRFFE
jgi:hypothetical protein